jgi:hypothetical protein
MFTLGVLFKHIYTWWVQCEVAYAIPSQLEWHRRKGIDIIGTREKGSEN